MEMRRTRDSERQRERERERDKHIHNHCIRSLWSMNMNVSDYSFIYLFKEMKVVKGMDSDAHPTGNQSRLSHLPRQYTYPLSPIVKQQCNNTTMLRLLLLYQFWLAKIYICYKSPRQETRRVTNKLYPQEWSSFRFSYFRHSCSVLNFKVGPFACHFLLLSVFFLVLSHFISLVRPAHHLFFVFLPSRGRLLDSHKRRLFCLHMHPSIHCLFKRRLLVSSSEAAVWGFCLLISLQENDKYINIKQKIHILTTKTCFWGRG